MHVQYFLMYIFANHFIQKPICDNPMRGIIHHMQHVSEQLAHYPCNPEKSTYTA